jgi:hypothetical protein
MPGYSARAAAPAGLYSYKIALTSPGHAAQSAVITAPETSVTITVEPGEWDISAEAFDSSNMLLGIGTGRASVSAGKTAGVVITMTFTVDFNSQGIFCVKPVASGTGDGSSWTNASDLSTMLWRAQSEMAIEQIWVTAGTHKPNRHAATSAISLTDKNNAFVLVEGVKIYGGFTGTESSLTQRNWKNNETVLSGDLNNDNILSIGNAYHVVIAADISSGGATVLDGFTVTAGYTSTSSGSINVNGYIIDDRYGGGIYNKNASPSLTNLIVENNSDNGIYNDASSPAITACKIYNNFAGTGGGMYNVSGSAPQLVNVVISGNSASYGAGMYNNDSVPVLTNVTIVRNSGGAIYNNNVTSSIQIKNSLIWGNSTPQIDAYSSSAPTYSYSGLEGENLTSYDGLDGTAVLAGIFESPYSTITKTPLGDYHLKGGSPAINVGNNTYVSGIDSDTDGRPRIYNTTVDLGAYEYQP